MSDITYSVEVQYLQSGNFNAPAAGLQKLQNRADGLSDSLLRGVSSFAGSFNGALDTLGGTVLGFGESAGLALGGALVTGLGMTLKEGLGFASYVESEINGIAGTMTMLAGVSFDKGLKQAAESTEHLRQLAIQLPGTFKQAADAFSYVLPVGLEHNVAIDRLEKLSALGVAAASSLGVNQKTAGHETAAILEGRARSSMPMFAKLGLGSASAFNALPFEKRLDAIESRYKKLEPAMGAFGGSFSGLTSAVGDQARNVSKSLAMPLFYSLKDEMSHALTWFGNNEGEIHAWATRLGVALDYQFHRGLDLIHEWYGPVATFTQTLGTGMHSAFSRIEPWLIRFEDVAKRFMSDPQAFDKIASGAKTFAELRVGGAALQGGASLMSSIGGMGGGGTGSAAGLLGMGEALPFVVVGLAALATAAYGVTSALAEQDSAFHNLTANSVTQLATDTTALGAAVTEHSAEFKTASQALGYAATLLADNQIKAATAMTWAANGLVDAFGLAAGALSKISPKLNPTDPEPYNRTVDYSPSAKWLNAANEKEGERKIPQNVTHFHAGAVQLHVNGNSDPTRVAKKTADILMGIARHPKTASLTGGSVMTR